MLEKLKRMDKFCQRVSRSEKHTVDTANHHSAKEFGGIKAGVPRLVKHS
jgi:hypothetical protein